MSKPPVGRPFQKGQSGNPGGRRKVSAHVTELAQAETEACIRKLVALRDGKKVAHTVQLGATTALLDRAWGKPTQPIEGNFNLSSLTDEQLQQLADIRAAASQPGGNQGGAGEAGS